MKTFFTVFFAILAAAAVIFAALSINARLVEWEQGTRACYLQIQSEAEWATKRAEGEKAETELLALRAHNSSDVDEVRRRALLATVDAALSLSRVRMAQLKLIQLFEHKPFGLPLTADQRKELESAKADIAKSTDTQKK